MQFIGAQPDELLLSGKQVALRVEHFKINGDAVLVTQDSGLRETALSGDGTLLGDDLLAVALPSH